MENKSSLGFFEIIRESFKTISRNRKLLGPILLIVFLSFSQLDFAYKYVLAPISRDFLTLIAKHLYMVQGFTYSIHQIAYVGALNVREILLVKILIMAISAIITLVFVVATVSSSSEAYIAKLLGPREIFLKLKKSWTRPLVTSFYMTLLTLGLFFLYIITIGVVGYQALIPLTHGLLTRSMDLTHQDYPTGVTSILALNFWTFLFLGAITLAIPVCYFYVAAFWIVSVIVSILEEGSSGLKAIGRAAELMKGKRLLASLMMVLFTIAYFVVVYIATVVTSDNRSWSVELAFTIPFTNGFFCLLKLFMFVVFTIFYHEQKTSHDEKEGKGFYVPIVIDEP